MPSKIVERVTKKVGFVRLFPALAQDLSPSDLQSLMLEVYQARTARLNENNLRERASRGLTSASRVDGRLFNLFDRIAFEQARGFEAVELSPVGPLGLNCVLGEIGQNSVLTTIRNAEILGDSTMALALECFRRRKAVPQRTDDLRLCSSHRLVRMQPFDFPGFVPHFRLFAMVTAGRDRGSGAFEIEHLSEHICFYLNLLRALNTNGFQVGDSLIEVSDTFVTRSLLESEGVHPELVSEAIRAHRVGGSERFLREQGVSLPAAIEDPARELTGLSGCDTQLNRLALLRTHAQEMLRDYPEARLRFNFARLEGLSYYHGLCMRISPLAPDGAPYAVIDGGLTDWTARLLEDKKERLLTSGIGTEFICSRYRG